MRSGTTLAVGILLLAILGAAVLQFVLMVD
jgi:hypothetical protein